MADLTLKQIAELTGLTRTRLYDLKRDGRFPKETKQIKSTKLYDAAEIKQWWEKYRKEGHRSTKKLREIDIPADAATLETENLKIIDQNERLKSMEAQARRLEELLALADEQLGDDAAAALMVKEGRVRTVEALLKIWKQAAEEVGDVSEGEEFVLRIAGVDVDDI